MSDNGDGENRAKQIKSLPRKVCPEDGTLLFKSDGEYLEITCRTCRRQGRDPLVVFDLREDKAKAKSAEIAA